MEYIRTPTTPELPRLDVPAWVWVGMIALLKAADAGSTYLGLRMGYVESNTIPAAAFDALGTVAGIVFMATLAFVLVVVAVEGGRWAFDHYAADSGWGRYVRPLGYGSHVLISAYTVAVNLSLLL